jgi:cyclic pyranopterin monophosphate synthase
MPHSLTHLRADGSAHMVDISQKPATDRRAVAEGYLIMQPKTLVLIREGQAKKGDVIGAARIAGIMAAKRAAELIPLCHPLPLTHIAIDCIEDETRQGLKVTCEARTNGPTGVEMEALTGVTIACLTLYDMVKSVDSSLHIEGIMLIAKSGGKADFG